ncbi:MAG: flagellar hook-basal body complex protein FliE [Halanaerobiales bacterium]
MINPVNSNFNFTIGEKSDRNTAASDNAGTSFVEMLKNNLNDTNQAVIEADQVTEAFATGKIDDIHRVTIATENARVALNLTLAIQNKVMQAYNEIMRLQI